MKKEFIGLTAVHFNSVLGCGILSAFSGLSSIKWDKLSLYKGINYHTCTGTSLFMQYVTWCFLLHLLRTYCLSEFSSMCIWYTSFLPHLEATQKIWHYSLIHGCLLCLKFFCG